MRFFQLAESPPLICTLFFLIVWALAASLPAVSQPLAIGLIAFQMAWIFDLFLLSQPAGSRQAGLLTIVLFAVPVASPLMMLVLLAGGIPGAQPSSAHLRSVTSVGDGIFLIVLLLGAASFFIATWKCARSFVNAEIARGTPPRNPIGTFVLILYLFIGVWWLHQRIKKVIS